MLVSLPIPTQDVEDNWKTCCNQLDKAVWVFDEGVQVIYYFWPFSKQILVGRPTENVIQTICRIKKVDETKYPLLIHSLPQQDFSFQGHLIL